MKALYIKLLTVWKAFCDRQEGEKFRRQSESLLVGQLCGACHRRGATADFSPAFQGREQWTSPFASRPRLKLEGFSIVATRRDRIHDLIPALKGRAKVSRRSATKSTTQLLCSRKRC
jgi:hypothetical protein